MGKDINLTSKEWCDILFEDKNKDFGAYSIRRTSSKRYIIAIIAAVLFTIIVAILPTLIKTVAEATRTQVSEGLVESTVLAELKDIKDQVPEENIIRQQENIPPPPALKSTIKFTAPVITSSEEISEDDGMKSQDELAESKLQISIANVEGTDEEHGVDIADLEEHKVIVQEEAPEIFRYVDQSPEFPGGEAELNSFIKSNIKYPQIARELGIQGKVYVEFVVSKSGKVINIKVVRSPDNNLSQEAIRVVKLMPDWIPGKQNGHNVNAYFILPVDFKLM